MRCPRIFPAAALLCVLSSAAMAAAADQVINAPETGNPLHRISGKAYWEMFAVCFASANAVLAKAAIDHNESQQTEMEALAAGVLERGIARLVTDRVVFEGEAEEIFYARAAEFMPVAEFTGACRLYIQDHDARFGAPK